MLISVSILQSCSLIHLLSTTEKKYDSDLRISSFLEKASIDTNFSYRLNANYVDSLSILKYALNTYKLKSGAQASPLQIRLYDKNGNFIYGWEQCFGDLNKFNLLDSLPFNQKKHLHVNLNLSFYNDVNIFDISYTEKEILLKEIRNYDYTIVVFWASWTGWYSKNALISVKKYIEDNPDYKILFIKLNTTTHLQKEN